MNRVAKKITLVATSLTLALGMSMSVMAAKNDSNKCGKNAIYEFNKSTRTLTIQGKGTVKGKHSWKKLKPKKVVIKDGITEIGYSAFASLKTLRSVIIPNSVRKIDGYAFECSSLKKLNLPKSVEVIGTGAFSETKLKEVTVPKSVKKMGSYVFGSCGRLKKVEWNYSYIPARTFSYCTSLDKISIKSKVQHIGIEALEGTAIKAFTVPSSVTNMERGVFSNCKKLESVKLSSRLKEIPKDTFFNTPALKKIHIPNGVQVIEGEAFEESGVENLVLPNSVTQMKPYAFAGAKQLKQITLSDSLKRIEHDTFNNCVQLEQVKFGSKLELIGEEAFVNCKLTNLVIPSTVKTVEYGAFKNTKCQKVTIQEGVRIIDYWIFAQCGELKSISIPSTVTTFQTNALSKCPKLTTITVAAKNGKYAVSDNCLTSKDGKTLLVVPGSKTGTFEIPEAVTTIDQEAFTGCTKISAFATNKNQNMTTKNGMLCSKDGTKLIAAPQNVSGTLRIPDGIKTIGAAAVHYSKASAIVIPNTVTVIDPCAFEYCNNITEITIPGSVYQIPEAGFWECAKLRTVTLEEGISRIWRNGFYGCKNLKKITLPKSLSYIHKTAFEECSGGLKIYCNKNSLAMAYATKYYFNYRII